MSNSPLVHYTRISPNSSNPRNKPITKITIHHVAGNLTVEQVGNIFAPLARRASSNYGVDGRGRIGMYVEEKNRSWCTSNRENDHQAITIEVSNSGGGPNWPVSDVALAKTVDLCVDICKRNGIKELSYTGDKHGNLTRHNMFAATACPGPYLQSKFPYIAAEVNRRLNVKVVPPIPSGDFYTVVKGDSFWKIAGKVYGDPMRYKELIALNPDVNPDTLQVGQRIHISEGTTELAPEKPVGTAPYMVRVTATALNIRSGPGTQYKITGTIRDQGAYTIVKTSSKWGNLKSGGWIHLDYTRRI